MRTDWESEGTDNKTMHADIDIKVYYLPCDRRGDRFEMNHSEREWTTTKNPTCLC